MYRPTDNNNDYTQDLCNALSDLSARFKDLIIWLGGDTNLPDIDWKTDTITGHIYPVSINQTYIDTFNHIGCEQIVNFPTRINNILDVFCTNRPSLIDRCTPIYRHIQPHRLWTNSKLPHQNKQHSWRLPYQPPFPNWQMHSNTRPQWPWHCFDGYKCPTNLSKADQKENLPMKRGR